MFCGICHFQLPQDATTLESDCSDMEWDYHQATSKTWSHSELQQSIQRGCLACWNIIESVAGREEGLAGIDVFSERGMTLELEYNDNRLLDRAIVHYTLSSFIPPIYLYFQFLYEISSPGKRSASGCLQFEGERLLIDGTGAETAFSHITRWLATCRSRHTACRLASVYSPSRLLAVGNSESSVLRFVENPDDSVVYAALSHRWTLETKGTSLTMENIHIRRDQGVDLLTLPQTMQDAVKLLRKLDIAYIWIDSLCIIQDDLEDWKHEAVLMAKVYNNAELTISATSAEDEGEGLFYDRGHIIEGGQTIISQIDNRSIYLRQVLPHLWDRGSREWETSRDNKDSDDWPLTLRGWVYQEEYLARRTILFTRNEVVWSCEQTTECECDHYRVRRKVGEQEVNVISPKSGEWSSIVEDYSSRSFTEEKDRLPAIAGVAQVLHDRYPQTYRQYMCGIWQGNDLIRQLSWHVRHPASYHERVEKLPSWTWASIDRRVYYKTSSQTISLTEEPRDDVRVRGCKVITKGNVNMADVKLAQIRLKARLYPVEIRLIANQLGQPSYRQYGVMIARHKCDLFFPDAYYKDFDYDQDTEDKLRALIFFTMDDPWTTPSEISEGIILRRVDDVGEKYERVGWFEGLDADVDMIARTIQPIKFSLV